jgi:hypothetical protein
MNPADEGDEPIPIEDRGLYFDGVSQFLNI